MERKQTVADLMGRTETGLVDGGYNAMGMREKLAASTEIERERVMELIFIAEPQECEIVDGRVVIRKQVIARNRDHAIRKFGIEVK